MYISGDESDSSSSSESEYEYFSWVGNGKEEIAPQLSNRKTRTSRKTIQMILKYEKIRINDEEYGIGDSIFYGKLNQNNIGKIKEMWRDSNQVRKNIIEITRCSLKKTRRKKAISDPSLKVQPIFFYFILLTIIIFLKIRVLKVISYLIFLFLI